VIVVTVNNALEHAKRDAVECAKSHQIPYCVVIGYDDRDRLAWIPVPTNEVGKHEDVVFIAFPDGSVFND
jgi:hypothetical protein